MNEEIYLKILRIIDECPKITQRELAEQLGVSLGKINYCLKALKEKGFVKWGNFSSNPNKTQYLNLLTPVGVSEKMFLTASFLKRKYDEYDNLNQEIQLLELEIEKMSLSKIENKVQMMTNHRQNIKLKRV
jgi:EPS-associated MarR family transcriptional regulator